MFIGKYEGHVYRKCTRKRCESCKGLGEHRLRAFRSPCNSCNGSGQTYCGGCRGEGMDCMYECLSCCSVCNAYEGSLLPFCPGRPVSFDEQEAHYKHYCAGTGPFARCTLETIEEAYQLAFQHEVFNCRPRASRVHAALRELRLLLARRSSQLWRWSTKQDEHVCPACAKNDGQDIKANWPRDASSLPPHVGCTNPAGCRCIAECGPVIRGSVTFPINYIEKP